jgi:uncharacterized protein (TIGR03437 family)
VNTILAPTLLLAGVGIVPVFAGNQILLRNFNSSDGTPIVLAAGTSGQLYVASELLPTSTTQITRVVELDLNGVRLASIDLPGMLYLNAAVVDSKGDLIVAGENQTYQGILLKIDPQLANATTLVSLPATLSAIALDGAGNIYVTGHTSSVSFPVTAGAYQTTPPYNGDPRLPTYGFATYAFVTEVSPAGTLLYSTYFGSDATACNGGSFCINKFGTTYGTAIAVDASGGVVIAGTTTSNGLPTTAGVLAPTCVCGYNYSYGAGIDAGFIAKFQPSASQQLQWSTFLNATYSPMPLTLNGMAVDSAGNVIVGGSADTGLPTTGGTFQLTAGSNPTGGGYLLKVNSTGTAAIWGTYFDGALRAVLLDSVGRMVIGGYTGIAQVAGPVSLSFVGKVTGDGSTLSDFYQGPEGYGAALAITSTGGFASVLPSGALWIETLSPGPSLLNVANSASGQYADSIGPVELITLYGVGIGPQTSLDGQVKGGVYTSSLGGYQVLFNGVAVPLLYADSGQINAVVPGGISGSTHIQVVTPTGTIDGPVVPTSNSPATGIFQSPAGWAAALNQDGSVNSPANPAQSGSIVAVFVDAYSGQYFPDGGLVPIGIYDATPTVWVLDPWYRSLEAVWAGAAPGIVNGVMQVNFRLPATPPAGGGFAFAVLVGGVRSPQSMVAVTP